MSVDLARTALVATLMLSDASASYAQNTSTAASLPSTETRSHEGHGSPRETQKASQAQQGHTAHQKAGEQEPYPEGIPLITDEDRAAAFPKLNGQHAVHDDGVYYYVLFDQLEWQVGDAWNAGSWDNRGWIGGDVNRFWFRTEGEAEGGDIAEAQAQALFGRAIHPWWDVVVGVRQDFRPSPGRTWAAVGIQGVAPYWFEIEATAYVGESGRTHFRIETEYDLLLTNRLILQPLVELEISGKSDPERETSVGLSTGEAGLRLRYELRREFAPYIGVAWHRKFFGTADLAEAAGENTSAVRLALGVRVWF